MSNDPLGDHLLFYYVDELSRFNISFNAVVAPFIPFIYPFFALFLENLPASFPNDFFVLVMVSSLLKNSLQIGIFRKVPSIL